MKNLRRISVTQARKELGNVFSEVNYNRERIVLTNQKKCVAIVPIEDLERLEAMEDAEDIREAELALKEVDEEGSISFDEMKKRVG
jgi:prevent-host-death family protein